MTPPEERIKRKGKQRVRPKELHGGHGSQGGHGGDESAEEARASELGATLWQAEQSEQQWATPGEPVLADIDSLLTAANGFPGQINTIGGSGEAKSNFLPKTYFLPSAASIVAFRAKEAAREAKLAARQSKADWLKRM